MAVTWTFSNVNKRQIYTPENVPGPKMYLCSATITADASGAYVTNGSAADLTAATVFDLTADANFRTIQFSLAGATNTPTTVLAPFYDETNNLLMLFVGDSSADGTVEAANALSIADVSMTVFAYVEDT